MSTTATATVEPPRYEYYYRDNHINNKREVLTGDRAVETFISIPVVDISGLYSPNLSDRLAVAKEMCSVCETVGFMYIKNHGIPQSLTDDIFAVSKAYHALPTETKMRQYVHNNPSLRGYDQHFSPTPDGLVEKKGSFLYSYDPDEDPTPPQLTAEQRAMCLGLHNPFLAALEADVPGFRATLMRYHTALIALSRRMMRAFALGLGADETYFDASVDAPFVSIILQHYLPTHPQTEDLDSLGAHTDFETFTILNQDSVGGLEVLNKNGVYVPAPYIHGTFVVNVGDFLERVSNDRLVSTVHRVRNATGRERFSIPFFFGFDMHTPVGVMPSCVSDENPARYEPRMLYEYHAKKRQAQKDHHAKPGLDNPLA